MGNSKSSELDERAGLMGTDMGETDNAHYSKLSSFPNILKMGAICCNFVTVILYLVMTVLGYQVQVHFTIC